MADVKIKREPGTEDPDDSDGPSSLQRIRQADPATEPEWIPEWESTSSESGDSEDEEGDDAETNGVGTRRSTRGSDRPEYKIGCIMKRKSGVPLYGLAACRGGEPYDRYFATAGGKELAVFRNRGRDIDVVQVYRDTSRSETFYCCEWTIDPATAEPLLVAGGTGCILKVLNVSRFSMVATLDGHGGCINDIQVHPLDPCLIASASADQSARLWNIATNVCVAVFGGDWGHRDQVLHVGFHPLGTALVTGSMDNTVKLWALDGSDEPGARNADSKTNNNKNEAEEYEREGSASTVPSAKSVSSASEAAALVFPGARLHESPWARIPQAIIASHRHPSDDPRRCFKTRLVADPIFSTSTVHSDYVDSVAFVGNLILSRAARHRILLWAPDPVQSAASPSVEGVTRLQQFQSSHAECWFLPFATSPDQRWVAQGTEAGMVVMWPLDATNQWQVAASHRLRTNSRKVIVRRVAFTADGKSVLATTDEGHIYRWDQVES